MSESSVVQQSLESGSCSRLDFARRDAAAFISEAIIADQQSASEIDLSLTWRELTQGLSVVVGSFFTSTRCGLVLAPTSCPSDPPLAGRRLEILESVLCGLSQNHVALDLGVAPSTIASHARLALEGMGVFGRPSLVHPLLMLAATATRQRSLAAGSLSFVTSGSSDLQVIGIPRPDRRLVGVLPSAELEVIRCLVEGCCYAEIAQRRGTAERTIANQITAVFRRLQVSGRSELLQRLFELEGTSRPAPRTDSTPPPPPTVRHPLTAGQAPAKDSHISGIRPVSELKAPVRIAIGR